MGTSCMFRGVSRMAPRFPYFVQGEVVKGFGRGSKDLGIPTANFPDSVVEVLPSDFDCGIYYGWACVGDNSSVYKMVLSIGWNPFYKNQKKTMETHIMHKFKDDFYGSLLKVIVVGYIRPEQSFTSVDELIEAIHSDIRIATDLLEKPVNRAFQQHSFFHLHHNL